MIVTVNIDQSDDEAPVVVEFGKVWSQAKVGEPHVWFQWDGAHYSIDDLRDHLRELEATRDKYREIMSALGRAT